MKFKDQADAIEQLCLKVFGAKPEYAAPANGFRYFRRGDTLWKMPPQGNGFIRSEGDRDWEDSICDLHEMTSPPSTSEISAEEGEP